MESHNPNGLETLVLEWRSWLMERTPLCMASPQEACAHWSCQNG